MLRNARIQTPETSPRALGTGRFVRRADVDGQRREVRTFSGGPCDPEGPCFRLRALRRSLTDHRAAKSENCTTAVHKGSLGPRVHWRRHSEQIGVLALAQAAANAQVRKRQSPAPSRAPNPLRHPCKLLSSLACTPLTPSAWRAPSMRSLGKTLDARGRLRTPAAPSSPGLAGTRCATRGPCAGQVCPEAMSAEPKRFECVLWRPDERLGPSIRKAGCNAKSTPFSPPSSPRWPRWALLVW